LTADGVGVKVGTTVPQTITNHCQRVRCGSPMTSAAAKSKTLEIYGEIAQYRAMVQRIA